MDIGRGRALGQGRARGRPPPQSASQSGPSGLVIPPPVQPSHEVPQVGGFHQTSAPQPTGAIGGRAALRGNGQMHGSGEQIHGAMSQISIHTESTHGSSSGKDRGAGDAPRARRGMGADTICTRPQHIVNKQGASGRQVTVITNLFRLVKKNVFSFYHFHVAFNPEVINPRIRNGMLYSLRDKIGSVFQFDGTSLFLPHNLEKPEMEFTVPRKTDSAPIVIRIRFVAVLSPNNPVCIQVFNIIFKKVLNHIGLQMIQRNYYNPQQAINVEKYMLTIWPGYITSILQYELDTSLMADISHKILSTATLLDRLYDIEKRSRGNCEEQAKAELVGSIVLTRYNNKTYKVDDIDWSKDPTHEFEMRNGTKQSYIEYYKTHHEITIRDKKQPLVIVMPSKRERRSGQEGPICLIPELCYMTGLSDSARKDMTMMRELAGHTRIGPQDRVKTLQGFLRQIKNNEQAVKEFDNWNIGLDNDLMEIAARLLATERIQVGQNRRTNTSEISYDPASAEWSREMKGFPLMQPANIRNWVFIFTARDAQNARNFGEAICRAANELGMNMAERDCRVCDIPDINVATYMRALKSNVTKDTEFVMVLLPSARQDLYSSIKKYLCVDMPVPSQVMLGKTISKPQMLRSVATKVAIQINSKMGMQCWAVKIPLDNVMVVGIDTYHDSQKKGRSVMGIVASLNKNLNRFYTCWNFQSNMEEIGRGLTIGLINVLKKYNEVNEKLPTKIIIYRDGVGDGQLRVVYEFELEQIKKAFTQLGGDYQPALSLVVVQKRVNSRFFVRENQTIRNPLPGTLIDTGATRPEWYDFFVVSQSVRQGTVTPTHYNVIYDTSNLKPDHMQQLTYKLCHLYYNWQGTIRVPAPCMYAHKVAFLIGQSIHASPSTILADKLFYL